LSTHTFRAALERANSAEAGDDNTHRETSEEPEIRHALTVATHGVRIMTDPSLGEPVTNSS
jgi:hypothetical protein